MATLAGPKVLEELIPALRASLERLERFAVPPAGSPITALQLATLLHVQSGLLLAIAGELETRAHADLGRFGAEVVELAAKANDAETAACEVAESFLALARVSPE